MKVVFKCEQMVVPAVGSVILLKENRGLQEESISSSALSLHLLTSVQVSDLQPQHFMSQHLKVTPVCVCVHSLTPCYFSFPEEL